MASASRINHQLTRSVRSALCATKINNVYPRSAIAISTTKRIPTARLHTSRTLTAMNPSLSADLCHKNDHTATSKHSIDKSAPTSFADPIFQYSEQHSTPLPEIYSRVHARSIEHFPGSADKSVSALQGQFLRILMKMTRPKNVLELGCFIGYSAMAMADGMPDGGTVYTCEKDAKAAQLARDTIQERHGLCKEGHEAVKIDLWEDSAMKSLETMAKNGLQFDAIFIDADKGNYINYFDFILANDLLSKGGYILADNILFRGMVLDSNKERGDHDMSFLPPSPPPSPPLSPQSNDSSSKDKRMKRSQMSLQKTADRMDAFNRHVKKDQRVEVVVLPIFDGISIIVKK